MRILELFAGAGGFALGSHAAGAEHAALVEFDPSACATLRAAGLGPVVEGDVRDLDAIDAVVGPTVDAIASGFPCQPFSQAGLREGAADARNGWPHTIAAIDRFRPAWFIGENVAGLTHHEGECIFRGGQESLFYQPDPKRCPGCYLERVILPELRARFAFSGMWMIDAADLGVPQRRNRLILWAGPRPVVAPRLTHGTGRLLWKSMGGALSIEGGAPWLTRPAPTVSAVSECKGSGPGSSPEKLQRASDALYLATGRRRLTWQECAILQAFPTDHPFHGTSSSIYRQVGNAVPPPLAEAVVRSVMAADRLHRSTMPGEGCSMSAAASHVFALATPDGIPAAPLVPITCLVVGLLLGVLLSWAELQRLYRRESWMTLTLDSARAALESEQARAQITETRLRGELTAARAAEEVARGLAREAGLLR